MARIRVVATLVALAVALSIPGTALAAESASPAHFCVKPSAGFYPRQVQVGTSAELELGADNCGEKVHVLITWRISGPCHPRYAGSQVFVLDRNSGFIGIDGFRPACVGQYRLTVRAYHKNRVVDVARAYLQAT